MAATLDRDTALAALVLLAAADHLIASRLGTINTARRDVLAEMQDQLGVDVETKAREV